METAANLPESVTNAFVRAINRQDADALAALMTSGHRFVDSLGNIVEGRENMRRGWTGYFQMVPDYTVAIDETYSNGPVVILMGIAQGTYARGGKITRRQMSGVPRLLYALLWKMAWLRSGGFMRITNRFAG